MELADRSSDRDRDREVTIDPNPWPSSYTPPRPFITGRISLWTHLPYPSEDLVVNQPMAERPQRSGEHTPNIVCPALPPERYDALGYLQPPQRVSELLTSDEIVFVHRTGMLALPEESDASEWRTSRPGGATHRIPVYDDGTGKIRV